MKTRTLLLCSFMVACLDGAHEGRPATVEPDADRDVGDAGAEVEAADELDHVVAIAVGTTGVCTQWHSGHMICDGRPVADEARAIAAAGTFVWHLELMGCAIDDGIVCASELQRYRLETPEPPTMIALGDHMGAVALPSGEVLTWEPLAPTTLTSAPVRHPTALTCGYTFCCAIVDGGVSCWGDGPAVPALSGVTAIAAGLYHVCALTDGAVDCWGTQPDLVAPVMSEPIVAIEAGIWTTCALGKSGAVACVASGEAFTHWFNAPVVQLDVGGDICALLTDGTVECVRRE